MKVASGQLWSGNPAVYLRDLTSEEMGALAQEAHDLAVLGAHHAVEVDKSIAQIEAEKEKAKDLYARGGDTIMNPNPNFFEERPGLLFDQEGTGNVTYQSVDQRTIDARVFNRYRESEPEITRDIREGKDSTKAKRSIDKSHGDIVKELKSGRPGDYVDHL